MRSTIVNAILSVLFLAVVSGLAPSSSQAAIEDGLVAYYPLDGNANDGSTMHNNMVSFGDASFGTGKVGSGGGLFDGTGDYFGTSGTDIFGGAPTAYSWQAWIKPQADVTGQDDYILATTDAANSNAGFAISARIDSSEQLDVFKSTSNANWWNNHNNPLSGASPMSTDGWYHVATSWDGTNLDVYVNGTLDNGTEVATNSASESDIPTFTPSGLRIGTDQNAPDRFFHGEIDEVAVWDRAISAAEISSLYNGGNGFALPVSTPEPPDPPAGNVVWTMAIIPDTQNYVRDASDEALFDQMTQWIKDNKVSRNIGLVLHEGDIVNNNNNGSGSGSNLPSTQQWQHAQDAMFTLNGEVPYIMSTGNHDHGTTNAQDRSTEFNNYFKATDNPLIDPAQGGILKGTWTPPPVGPPPRGGGGGGTGGDTDGPLENAYYEYIAPDGRKLLVFSLEWGPRQDVVDWAESIADDPEYADHTAILLTHAYMYNDDTRYDWATKGSGQSWNPHSYGTAGDTNDGEELWNELVKLNGNFEMTFNGHVLGDGLG
ncbi:MAG: LamG-like jellyroll fold domain-containing protein, partial [Bythopirellula sp.]